MTVKLKCVYPIILITDNKTPNTWKIAKPQSITLLHVNTGLASTTCQATLFISLSKTQKPLSETNCVPSDAFTQCVTGNIFHSIVSLSASLGLWVRHTLLIYSSIYSHLRIAFQTKLRITCEVSSALVKQTADVRGRLKRLCTLLLFVTEHYLSQQCLFLSSPQWIFRLWKWSNVAPKAQLDSTLFTFLVN